MHIHKYIIHLRLVFERRSIGDTDLHVSCAHAAACQDLLATAGGAAVLQAVVPA